MTLFYELLSLAVKSLTVLVFVACLGYCLYIQYIHLKHDHIPGPPRDNFLLGHAPTFLRITNKDEVAQEQFLKWAEIYGPVYRVNILHHVFLCVSCPEAIKELLMSSKFPKDKFSYHRMVDLFGQRFLGNGLVTSRNHELWYKQRRAMDPAFSSLYLRGLLGPFNDKAEDLMDTLSDVADKNVETNMLHLFSCVTLDVIAKVAFGKDLDPLRKTSPFPDAIRTCINGMVYYIRHVVFEFIPKNRPFIKNVRKCCQLIRTTGAQWILDRKTAIQNGEDVPKDILTQMIKAAATEENTTEDQEIMLDNFVTFFLAGQETTANLLAFCVMVLGSHPEILEKLRKEVDDVIGMKPDINYEDLRKMSYLSQVLKETLRLYPTAPGTSRLIPEDMVISGVQIPAGVSCMLSSYVTGRMEKFFKDPMKFDPERFHPDVPQPYFTYFPFSLGSRSCIGKNFALLEAKVVLVKLIQRFEFSLVPGQTFDIQDTGPLRPKNGVVCFIKHRK